MWDGVHCLVVQTKNSFCTLYYINVLWVKVSIVHVRIFNKEIRHIRAPYIVIHCHHFSARKNCFSHGSLISPKIATEFRPWISFLRSVLSKSLLNVLTVSIRFKTDWFRNIFIAWSCPEKWSVINIMRLIVFKLVRFTVKQGISVNKVIKLIMIFLRRLFLHSFEFTTNKNPYLTDKRIKNFK